MERADESQPGRFTAVNDRRPTPESGELTADELLRRAHAEFLRLNSEIRLAKEREVTAQANLVEAQREADELVARALPRVDRVVDAVLEEADEEAAAILGVAEARALEISNEARQLFRQVVSQVQEALDDAWGADPPGPAPGAPPPATQPAPVPDPPAPPAPGKRAFAADDEWFAALWESQRGPGPPTEVPPAG